MELDHELLIVVREDLEYLIKKWDESIDDASLRITSPILRRLLVEDNLSHAANMLDFDFKILSSKMDHQMKNFPLDSLTFFQSGGAKYHGGSVSELAEYNKVLTKDDTEKVLNLYLEGKKAHAVKINTFRKEISFIVDGVIINREEVIMYIANKIGGVHFDEKRKDNILGEKHKLLDEIKDKYKVADKNSIYYELLSTGQYLTRSKHVHKLIKRIKKNT